MTNLDRLRLTVTAAAVLKPSVAVELLPVRKASALSWLRANVPIRVIDGAEMIIWGDVLSALRNTKNRGAVTNREAPRLADVK